MGRERCRHEHVAGRVQMHPRLGRHHRHHKEFTRYRRVLHIMPILIVVLVVLLAAVLYKWSGHENFSSLIGGIFAFLLVKEILQALFFKRISRRFIEPLIKLKTGFDIIGEGDYSTRVEEVGQGDMRMLFKAFNNMAEKLEEDERIKAQYEENRKMLIANISHDLKTPITTVGGYLEVLDEGVVTDPEKLKKYVRVMRNNTEYMNRLIDDLFLYSKLDIDQVRFEFENVNAKAFFSDMMQEFSMNLTEDGFDFDYIDEIDEAVCLYADGKRIHRAIRNIMDNAAKYAGDSSTAKINVHAQSADGYLTIKLKDYGPGIPDDKLGNVFDRFFRVDDERTKNLSSTGLGLAITKELINAHDGLIAAGNHEEGGAVFVIQLPLVACSD